VIEDGTIISEAARRLGVKLSTAKLILKRFKEEGTFF
jgi:transposase